MTKQLKAFAANPWIKIVQLFITSTVGLFLYFVVSAKDDLRNEIETNKSIIESLKEEVKEVEINQVQNTTVLQYIKETLDEVKSDVKHIREK